MKIVKMLNVNVKVCLLGLFIVGLSSCNSYKKIPYLGNGLSNNSSTVTIPSPFRENEVRFKIGDVLGITVNALGSESSLVADFNLPFQPTASADNTGENDVPQGIGRQTYLIDHEGFIDFPVIGKISVEGFTHDELEVELKSQLKKYLKVDPIITIRLLNYRVTILGEVGSPGIYPVSRDHINILEALAMAGDMTIYGQRENVKLIRELPDEKLEVVHLNLNDAWVASSPYFYLRQNDILYVEPNKTKSKSADIGAQTNLWLSLTSIGLSVVSIAVFLFNN